MNGREVLARCSGDWSVALAPNQQQMGERRRCHRHQTEQREDPHFYRDGQRRERAGVTKVKRGEWPNPILEYE